MRKCVEQTRKRVNGCERYSGLAPCRWRGITEAQNGQQRMHSKNHDDLGRTLKRRPCLNFKFSHAFLQFRVFLVARIKLDPLCRNLYNNHNQTWCTAQTHTSQSNVAHTLAGRQRRLGAGCVRAHLEMELVHLELASARLGRHPFLDFLGPFVDFLVDLANRPRSARPRGPSFTGTKDGTTPAR